jgi:hypothetical protein
LLVTVQYLFSDKGKRQIGYSDNVGRQAGRQAGRQDRSKKRNKLWFIIIL